MLGCLRCPDRYDGVEDSGAEAIDDSSTYHPKDVSGRGHGEHRVLREVKDGRSGAQRQSCERLGMNALE